jgi:hypothetical protein
MSGMRRLVHDFGQASQPRGQLSLLRTTEVAASASVQRVERILLGVSETVGVAAVVHVSHGSQAQSCLCGKNPSFVPNRKSAENYRPVTCRVTFLTFCNFFNRLELGA